MGSNSSKTQRFDGSAMSSASSTSSFSSSSSSVRSRRKSRGIFSSSCLGSSSRAYDSDNDDNEDDYQVSEHHNETSVARVQQSESEAGEVKVEGYQTVKVDEPDNNPCVSSDVVLSEWAQANRTNNATRTSGSSSQTQTTNHSNRFLSRFSFVPGSVSFRLNRAASVGSSRSTAYPSSPTSFPVDEDHLYRSWPLGLSRNVNSSSRVNSTNSSQELDVNNVCLPSLGETLNRRVSERQDGVRESVDRNVRFSRTLSVGRLRDRVLRRSSFSDLTLSPSRQEGTTTAALDRHALNSLTSSPYPMANTIPNRFLPSQSNDVELLNLRDPRRNDLIEHRSNFLERRRRIRSQVRALQRLGSRFENLSGHERYCILSGQHRTGRCSCRSTSTRESNSNDDGSARASISRIVMLAEALFEVLDEIHQQSVVLSSRPSLSSIGSVPAPNDVVESLPVRVYAKSPKLQTVEEVAQCYICLVEYEDGDDMRVLPCRHEFHKKCIDKWLKEIHRVCPLCRGDICKSDSLQIEN